MRTGFARISLLLASLPAWTAAHAQDEPKWLVDTMYGSGKINTVIIVVSVILLGIGFWLYRLDRRIARMENRSK